MKIGPKSPHVVASSKTGKKQVPASEMMRMRNKVVELAKRLTPPVHSMQKVLKGREAQTMASHATKVAVKTLKSRKG